MSLLILMRHGESEWNRQNRFTGWVDVPLSPKGIEEALQGGDLICDLPIDVIVMTTLIRSQMTAMLAMSRHRGGRVPVILHPGEDWRTIYNKDAPMIPVITCSDLNERMYGELQGYNKAKTAEKYGKDQVHIWRRSFAVAPPSGESLKDTSLRSIPYFKNVIAPMLKEGKNVLVSAHGNSLRSIVMYLDRLSEDEVVNLEIPLARPIIYRYTDLAFTKQ